jgi:hypothetical protein
VREVDDGLQAEDEWEVQDLAALQQMLLPDIYDLPEQSPASGKAAAATFRMTLQHKQQRSDCVCAVCQRNLLLVRVNVGPAPEQVQWREVVVKNIPNLQLLRKDLPQTAKLFFFFFDG